MRLLLATFCCWPLPEGAGCQALPEWCSQDSRQLAAALLGYLWSLSCCIHAVATERCHPAPAGRQLHWLPAMWQRCCCLQLSGAGITQRALICWACWGRPHPSLLVGAAQTSRTAGQPGAKLNAVLAFKQTSMCCSFCALGPVPSPPTCSQVSQADCPWSAVQAGCCLACCLEAIPGRRSRMGRGQRWALLPACGRPAFQ